MGGGNVSLLNSADWLRPCERAELSASLPGAAQQSVRGHGRVGRRAQYILLWATAAFGAEDRGSAGEDVTAGVHVRTSWSNPKMARRHALSVERLAVYQVSAQSVQPLCGYWGKMFWGSSKVPQVWHVPRAMTGTDAIR